MFLSVEKFIIFIWSYVIHLPIKNYFMKKLLQNIFAVCFYFICSTAGAQTTSISTAGPSIMDVEGHEYGTITTRCGQSWTRSNLYVSKYSDGTPIPEVKDPTQWANLKTGAWCWYNSNVSSIPSVQKYGKLYNWYAVMGIYDAASLTNPSLRKSLAPKGWHIPSNAEWSFYVYCIDPKADTICNNCTQSLMAGGTMKATTDWQSPNTGATNTSSFSGYPAGLRYYKGDFMELFTGGFWWSRTEAPDGVNAFFRSLSYNNSYIQRKSLPKACGFSVRLAKDPAF